MLTLRRWFDYIGKEKHCDAITSVFPADIGAVVASALGSTLELLVADVAIFFTLGAGAALPSLGVSAANLA